MFDEPSSYLDVSQRLRCAAAIRSLLSADNYVIVVEHDLAVLDFLSDFICCLYGVPTAYGVVTLPSGVREGLLLSFSFLSFSLFFFLITISRESLFLHPLYFWLYSFFSTFCVSISQLSNNTSPYERISFS